MRKLLLGAITALLMTTTANAEFKVVVPQKPTGGTGTWANIIATEINKFCLQMIKLCWNLFQEKMIVKH